MSSFEALAKPEVNEEVRVVAACAMISFIADLDDKGVRLHGFEGSMTCDLPAISGDPGVLGVTDPDTAACGASLGDGSALPLLSNHESSSCKLVPSAWTPFLALIEGDVCGDLADDAYSSSISNIMSFDEGFALSDGRSRSVSCFTTCEDRRRFFD